MFQEIDNLQNQLGQINGNKELTEKSARRSNLESSSSQSGLSAHLIHPNPLIRLPLTYPNYLGDVARAPGAIVGATSYALAKIFQETSTDF